MVKKDYTLDFLRVFSMFLVIVIHVCNCYCRNFDNISSFSYGIAAFINVLARISVPIFFMISGALLIPKNHTMSKYLDRVKRMIIILVLWTLVYLGWEYFYLGNTDINFVSLIFFPSRAHLWFMYAIIAIYLALPFISKMARNLTKEEENLFIVLWFIFSGIFIKGSSLLGFDINYSVPIISGTYYLGYFVVGHIVYKRVRSSLNLNIKKINTYSIITFILSNIVLTFLTIFVSFKGNYYYKGFLTYSNLFMILSSLSFYMFVLVNMKNKESFICRIAPYSFGIYLIHGIFLDVLKNVFDYLSINSLFGIPLYSLILFIISFGVIYVVKKVPKVNKYIC